MALPSLPVDERQRVAGFPAYAVLILVFLLHVSVGSFLQRTYLPFGIAYGELFFFAGIPWLVTLGTGFAPGRFLGFTPVAAPAWRWILLAALASFVLAGGTNTINRLLVGPELAEQFDSTRIFLSRPMGEKVALTIGVAVLAPLGEEILFRGYLMRILWGRYGAMGALLVTSSVFAVAHFNPASFLALFVLGLAFGLLRILSGSIVPALVAHGFQNGVTALFVLRGWTDGAEEEMGLLPALLLVAGSLPFLLLALGRIARLRGPAMEALPRDEGRAPTPGARLSWRPVLPALGIWLALAVASVAILLLVYR